MRRGYRYLLLSLVALGALLLAVASSASGTGNGGPSGSHYNLNIIGVDNPKKAAMDDSSRHTLFVPLRGGCQITLVVGSFNVNDGNCFDGDGAEFQLPNPDPENNGSTVYSVFARALGKPGGSSTTQTCFSDADGTYCSEILLELNREAGQTQFKNASKYLLYVYADTNDDNVLERNALFSDPLADYWWQYTNTGLRLAQLRFYDCVTVVPAATDPTGPQNDSDCFTK
jgi:hypothetical protein